MTTTFLVLTIFFPRIVLLVYYMQGWMPANTLPFWGDAVMVFFIPRVLVLLYIYQNLGVESGWFWLHVVALILCYAGGGTTASSRSSES